MRVFTSHMTRGATGALMIHGILLFLVGLWAFAESLNYVKHPYGTPAWRIYPAVGGWAMTIIVGAAIAVLGMFRLRKPFDGSASTGLPPVFKGLFVAEAVLVFGFGGMILDTGEMARRMFFGCLILNLNLLLLWLFRRRPREELGPKIV